MMKPRATDLHLLATAGLTAAVTKVLSVRLNRRLSDRLQVRALPGSAISCLRTLRSLSAKQKMASMMTLLLLVSTGPMPAAIAEAGKPQPPVGHYVPPVKRDVHVRKGPHKLNTFTSKLAFSNSPTDLEISTARVFQEPLVPMTSAPVAGENAALAKALLAFKAKGNPEDLSDLTAFVSKYPRSRWTPAVELNIGVLRFNTGYISKALPAWLACWNAAKGEKGKAQQAVANRAIAQYMLVNARLGKLDVLKAKFAELGKRPFFGSDEDMLGHARDGMWFMLHKPQCSYKCGPYAIDAIASIGKRVPKRSELVDKISSSENGTNLAQVKGWADQVGLKYQLAKRSKGAKVIAPAVMHWAVGHFAAIVGESHGHYILKDSTFDNSSTMGISKDVVDTECDGYFLVPNGPLPAGWQPLSVQEAQKVWGKGTTTGPDNNSNNCKVGKKNPCPTCGTDGCGMAVPLVWPMSASLCVQDVPLEYDPPFGRPMKFAISYSQFTTNQPSSFSFTNLGPNWSFSFFSYMTVNATTGVATIRLPLGGTEVATPSSGVYPPDLYSQAVLTSLGGGSYQRQLPDGTIFKYTLTDGSGNIFMTEIDDPQGNATLIQYDANYRITTITDPISQVSTIAYVSNTVGNSGFYKVASISDPFSRSCSFTYDSSNTNLMSITDVIGLKSAFTYDTSSTFITSMTTPYGTTAFYAYTPGSNPYPAHGLRFLLPDGTSAVIEAWYSETKTTYFWDREATALYPSDPAQKDYTHCETYTWLLNPSNLLEAAVPSSHTMPLENTEYYTYANEIAADYVGTINKPILVTKALGGSGYSSNQTAPGVINATIGGTVTTGNQVTITVNATAASAQNFTYTVQSGDTLSTIAASLASLINASTVLPQYKTFASSVGPVLTLSSDPPVATTAVWYTSSTSGGATETVTLKSQTKQTGQITLSGALSSGHTVQIQFNDDSLPGDNRTVTYTVQATDTLSTVAAALAAAVNADSVLNPAGYVASSSGAIVNVYAYSPYRIGFFPGGTGVAHISTTLVTNGFTQASQYQYNSLGKVTQSIDPVGRTFSYSYAANNIDLQQITETQGSDDFQIGAWTYNTQHRPLTYTDGSGQVTDYSYNSFGELKTLTDALSNVTTITYDANGFLTQIDGPLSGSDDITTFTYDSYNRLLTKEDSEGYTLTYSYDDMNRPTQTLYPDETTEQTIYDRLDAVLMKDRIGRWTQDSYNSVDQSAYEIDPLGRKTQYGWCACGSLASLIDPNGHETTWNHDLQGRVILKTYQDQTTISYVYESNDSRLRSKTDALGQTTNMSYNTDDTRYQISYVNAVNPTASVTYSWDPNYRRVSTIDKNDWGTYTYTYNAYDTPGGAAITGGGKLQKVHNDVIANSDVTYTYDALGRTTNRSINGSSNSIDWTYDAMSRVTAESNALGSFGYTYVDNTTGSSKGTLRLASISYPNSQVTNFSWYGNTGDQRLKEISNLDPSGNTLSQFDYGYDSAGEITQWQQQQNGNNLFYNLGYDLAGQLISAQAGSGSPVSPTAQEYHYSYDPGANRTAVQQSSMQTVRIGGSKTTGDVLTITVNDSGLSGGSEAVNYTVQSGDTLATIAQGLATAVNTDSSLQSLGVIANAHGSNTFINIRSLSTNITTYTSSTSVGATETISFGIFKNGVENAAIGGSKTTGDTLTVTVHDAALTGSHENVTYTVLSTDTLTSIATGVKNAINADSALSAIGVSATLAGTVVSISSTSTNATTYTKSTSSGATETISLSANTNPVALATVSGTKTTGDVLTLTVYDAALTGGSEAVSYTVLSGDTLTSIASGIASAINGDSSLSGIGISASSSSSVVSIQSNSVNQTSYRQTYSSGATESITMSNPSYGWQVAAIGGSKTTGDVLTVTAYNSALASGKESVTYTVGSSDTLTTIASGMAAAINSDANLSAIGVTASSSSTVVSIESMAPDLTTYTQSISSGATETITLGPTTGVVQSAYNDVNELVSQSSGGSTAFQGTTSKPVKSASLNSQVLSIAATAPATTSTFSTSATGTATETLTFATAPGAAGNGATYTITVGGTITVGDTLNIIFNEARLPGGTHTLSYTTKTGDTTSSVALAIYQAIGHDTTLSSNGISNYNRVSNVVYVLDATQSSTGTTSLGFESSLVGYATETVTAGYNSDQNTTLTIGGSATAGNVVALTVDNSALSGGSETVSYTVMSGDSLTAIATGLKNAVNADSNLQSIGVGATSSAAVVTLNTDTYYTVSTSGGATETLTLGTNNRGNVTVTVGGSPTTGDTLTVTANNASLSGGQHSVTYTVLSTDTLLTITEGLAAAINADSTLQNLGVTAPTSAATLAWSQQFSGNALLPSGTSGASASAVDGSNNTKTEGLQVSVKGPGTTSLTYDKNGNLTGDGTNSYKWDAANRMIEIDYAGSGNKSLFAYDGLSRNIQILEYSGGSLTSTKNFVWAQDRPDQPSEVRDASSAVSSAYYSAGQTNSGISYYYTTDHLGLTDTDVKPFASVAETPQGFNPVGSLGSTREVTNSAGVIQARLAYDSFGIAVFSGTLMPDFQYASYFVHSRSGLYLTRSRPYIAAFGRFASRDKLGEFGGVNLYGYVENSPTVHTDPSGNQASQEFPPEYYDCNRKCADNKPALMVHHLGVHLYLCPGDSLITPGKEGYRDDWATEYQNELGRHANSGNGNKGWIALAAALALGLALLLIFK